MPRAWAPGAPALVGGDLNTTSLGLSELGDAERVRRAKVIHAEGEFQASQKLAEAANVLAGQAQALQLRYLQTLTEISSERNTNTIVFPLPIDLVEPIFQQLKERG